MPKGFPMLIVFNGKTYNSLEEMPANERQAFEHMQQIFVDANGNGIPDFMEGDVAKNVVTALTGNVNFNGKVYTSLGELPPDAKQKVQEAFAKLNQLGILTNDSAAQISTFSSAGIEPAFQPSQPLIKPESVSQDFGGGSGWVIIVGLLAVLLLCAVAFAVVMYLR
jgi:hypothetical protein